MLDNVKILEIEKDNQPYIIIFKRLNKWVIIILINNQDYIIKLLMINNIML